MLVAVAASASFIITTGLFYRVHIYLDSFIAWTGVRLTLCYIEISYLICISDVDSPPLLILCLHLHVYLFVSAHMMSYIMFH